MVDGIQFVNGDSGILDSDRFTPASFLRQELESSGGVGSDTGDIASQIPGMAANFGNPLIPHVQTFQTFISNHARVYRDCDEATKNSLDNARFMRNDCGVMECIEARQRCVALLDWSLVPEDEKSHEQKELCDKLKKIISRIRLFPEWRYTLMHAIWYGKYAINNRFGWEKVGGDLVQMPVPKTDDDYGWQPINGDKLVFRFDDGNLPQGAYPNQLGIRVNAGYRPGDLVGNRFKVEQYGTKIAATDRGMAYFLDRHQRKLLTVHRHIIEDAPFEDALSSGSIHGIGIRSRIYWEWVQKQETLAFLMEYLERSAGGIEVWTYPMGNAEAKRQTETAAKNRQGGARNSIIVPKPLGVEGEQYGVQIIEPGMGGIDILKDILNTYYGHRIKRYILGQTLTTEAEATGLGSGVADAHMDTFMQIVRFDALKLQETTTWQLVEIIKNLNFPESKHFKVAFRLEVEHEDVEKKLQAFQTAYQMGAAIRETDVMEMIGAAIPGPGDKVLQMPQQQPGGMPGMGGQPGAGQPGGGVAPAASMTTQQFERAFAKAGAGGAGGQGGDDPNGGGSSPAGTPGGPVNPGDGGDRVPVGQYANHRWGDQQRDASGRWVKPHGAASEPDAPADDTSDELAELLAKIEELESDLKSVDPDEIGATELQVKHAAETLRSLKDRVAEIVRAQGGDAGEFEIHDIGDTDDDSDQDRYARRKPAANQKQLLGDNDQRFRWITIGGGSDGEGGEHHGGTHVKIDTRGNIVAGPAALKAKGITNLHDFGSDEHPDERAAKAGKAKKPKPIGNFKEKIAAQHQPGLFEADEELHGQRRMEFGGDEEGDEPAAAGPESSNWNQTEPEPVDGGKEPPKLRTGLSPQAKLFRDRFYRQHGIEPWQASPDELRSFADPNGAKWQIGMDYDSTIEELYQAGVIADPESVTNAGLMEIADDYPAAMNELQERNRSGAKVESKIGGEESKQPAEPAAELTIAGLTLEEASDLASRHGHTKDDAMKKMASRPHAWGDAVQGWIDAENAEKKQNRKDRREANWKPSEQQQHVLDAIGDARTFPKSQDMLMFSQHKKATEQLIKRGVIDRTDSGREVSYRLLSATLADSSSPPPEMTYEQFEKEYRAAFVQANKYGPNVVGGAEATQRMAELADKYPEWADRAEGVDSGDEELAAASDATASPDWSPETHLTIAADSIDKLRGQDVFRLLDSAPPEHMQAMADYIKKNRPELAGEVDEAHADVQDERGEGVGSVAPAAMESAAPAAEPAAEPTATAADEPPAAPAAPERVDDSTSLGDSGSSKNPPTIHGRVIRGNGKPVEFSRHLGNGKRASIISKGVIPRVGEVFESKGNLFVVTKVGSLDLATRDSLDDQDDFDKPSGWYSSFYAVPVERTEPEQRKLDSAKAEKERKEKENADRKSAIVESQRKFNEQQPQHVLEIAQPHGISVDWKPVENLKGHYEADYGGHRITKVENHSFDDYRVSYGLPDSVAKDWVMKNFHQMGRDESDADSFLGKYPDGVSGIREYRLLKSLSDEQKAELRRRANVRRQAESIVEQIHEIRRGGHGSKTGKEDDEISDLIEKLHRIAEAGDSDLVRIPYNSKRMLDRNKELFDAVRASNADAASLPKSFDTAGTIMDENDAGREAWYRYLAFGEDADRKVAIESGVAAAQKKAIELRRYEEEDRVKKDQESADRKAKRAAKAREESHSKGSEKRSMVQEKAESGGQIRAGGKTFQNKDDIKAMGARWDGTRKEWVLSLSGKSKSQLEAIERQIDRLKSRGVDFYRRGSDAVLFVTESQSPLAAAFQSAFDARS